MDEQDKEAVAKVLGLLSVLLEENESLEQRVRDLEQANLDYRLELLEDWRSGRTGDDE